MTKYQCPAGQVEELKMVAAIGGGNEETIIDCLIIDEVQAVGECSVDNPLTKQSFDQDGVELTTECFSFHRHTNSGNLMEVRRRYECIERYKEDQRSGNCLTD